MSRHTLVFSVFFILFQLSSGFTSESLKVNLNHGGVLIGRHEVTVKGRHMRAFMGVPYAKAPIGELRFKVRQNFSFIIIFSNLHIKKKQNILIINLYFFIFKSPEPFPPWKGEKLAIKESPVCIQIDPFIRETQARGDEDCLYLNIYTPPLKDIEAIGKLPVMVHMHGGGFEAGSGGAVLHGPQHLLDKNIIYVSGNYRLAALGFLSTETLECPGNFGLKDQVEILKWVQKHISSFGGNPNSVTIFGNSAGGASVNYLMQSKLSRGLFHKAIPQSGYIYNPWSQPMNKGEAAKEALKLAKIFKCESSDWSKVISCLRKVPALDITSKFLSFFKWDLYPIVPFQPVVEPQHKEAFLDNLPRNIKMGSLDIPVMTGIATSEGALMTAFFLNNPDLLKDLKNEVKKVFPIIFQYDHWSKDKQVQITQEIEHFYFEDGHNYEKKNHRNFTDVSIY